MALFGQSKNTSEKTNTQTMARQLNTPGPAQVNMIGEGTVFEGTLRAHSDVRVSGRVVGKLIVEGKAILAQEGAVEGELKATNADVAGFVKGQIHVEERLVLKGSARVEGDIVVARLVMEEGASFNGSCKMGHLEERRAAALKAGAKPAGDSRKLHVGSPAK